MKRQGEALKGEKEGVLGRGGGESRGKQLKTVRTGDFGECSARADRAGTQEKERAGS